MCGIFGIISDVKDTLNETVLGSCLNNLAHRGPDSSGIFIQKNIGLGHRRLAVYDLSEKGNQPMTRFGHTIVFNGAIYNFIEIRKELELKGYTFISDSDTEVILAAFDHYGKECVNHFNGQCDHVIVQHHPDALANAIL